MGRGVVTVVPITGNIRRVYPFHVRLAARSCGLSRDSKAQAEQIRAIAIERLRRRVGQAPRQTMKQRCACIWPYEDLHALPIHRHLSHGPVGITHTGSVWGAGRPTNEGLTHCERG